MKYKVVIVIDGESAEDMICAGAKDLAEHFLPKGKLILMDKKDIKKVMIQSDNMKDFLLSDKPVKIYEDIWERKDTKCKD